MLVIFIKIPFYTETQLEPESVLAEEEPMGTVIYLGCVCVCVETKTQHAFKCYYNLCVISFFNLCSFFFFFFYLSCDEKDGVCFHIGLLIFKYLRVKIFKDIWRFSALREL